ncbi:adenylate kinase [bacterium]
MNIILFGLPGSGKGTQAYKISDKFELEHISTGDLLRNEIKKNTDIGKKVKSIIDSGKLIPDELINEIINSDYNKDLNYIFDGYPRTLEQSNFFDEYLATQGKKIDIVIFLELETKVVFNRLLGRRKCPNCGENFNVYYNPPKNNPFCDICGTKLETRKDDKEDTIQKRMEVYEFETKPLLNYYSEKNVLVKVDASKSEKEVFETLLKIVSKKLNKVKDGTY